MKRLQSCCCCSTKTGTIVLAILGIITYCIYLIPLIYYSVVHQTVVSAWNYLQSNATIAINETEEYDAATQILSIMNTYLTAFLAVGYILVILMIAVNASLLHGVLNSKHKLMLPYIVVYMILLVVGFLGGVGVGIWMLITLSLAVGIMLIVIEIIASGLSLYFWFVVYSAYLDIRDVNEHHRVPQCEEN